MGEYDAKKFVQRGRPRLGLSVCKIQEKIEVEKCYRCWPYGHKAWNCSGLNRRVNCLNCAKEGHKREGCKEEAFENMKRDPSDYSRLLTTATRACKRGRSA
ncbi:hypothetical protein Zmor_018094 [Zophobas morio]|uniref:CCHC-type domain-containing protein n=1 Tax=Zophobas morio TaxID=2755281 RepID=A0AA38IAQ0_9CUCU|nr:hypothetical protein Zmor_018094 [Zophobas morio]